STCSSVAQNHHFSTSAQVRREPTSVHKCDRNHTGFYSVKKYFIAIKNFLDYIIWPMFRWARLAGSNTYLPIIRAVFLPIINSCRKISSLLNGGSMNIGAPQHWLIVIAIVFSSSFVLTGSGQQGSQPQGARVAQSPSTHPVEPPIEWIEPETGHRVIRLSRDPGSASLYFHQNAYTAAGDKLVITTPKGISTIELKTGKIELIVEGRTSSLIVGRKTRQVFYLKD